MATTHNAHPAPFRGVFNKTTLAAVRKAGITQKDLRAAVGYGLATKDFVAAVRAGQTRAVFAWTRPDGFVVNLMLDFYGGSVHCSVGTFYHGSKANREHMRKHRAWLAQEAADEAATHRSKLHPYVRHDQFTMYALGEHDVFSVNRVDKDGTVHAEGTGPDSKRTFSAEHMKAAEPFNH